jgi:hypothetical protein
MLPVLTGDQDATAWFGGLGNAGLPKPGSSKGGGKGKEGGKGRGRAKGKGGGVKGKGKKTQVDAGGT